MSESTATNKMSGRRIDRTKWDWMDEDNVNTDNPQYIKFIKDMEAKNDNIDQGRSQKRRDDTMAIVGWTIMAGVVLILGIAIITAVKSIM